MIPYSRQSVSNDDIAAVVEVLRGDFLTQGSVARQFESAIAGYCGASHAIATVNATAALHLALILLNVSEHDRVWVPAISFVATANCARYCGALVEFVDVEEDTGLVSLDELEQKLKTAEKFKRLPKVLVVVHIAGQLVDMQRLRDLCLHYDIRVVEDAAHALSAEYKGHRVGSCRFSDIAVFSFHPVKPITSGEGGMIVTNDSSLAARARLLIEHGIERKKENHINPTKSSWYYEQQELGFNYRLSDIHSALGLSQLSRLDHFLQERERLAELYYDRLERSVFRTPRRGGESRPSWHLFIVQSSGRALRDALMETLRSEGYSVNVHYLPIPSHPYYRGLGARPADFPGANHYAAHSLSLPLFPGLGDEHIDNVIAIGTRVSRSI